METHGTGTSLGDPIEINGLKKAFEELYRKRGKTPPPKPHCGLGSVKTNVGHLETAAGMAGIIKVVLAMQHKTLPATVHFEELNPYIQLEGSPFYIVKETRPWEPLKGDDGRIIPRRAGVSSFGFGGANAHIVLEEYEKGENNHHPHPASPLKGNGQQDEQIIVLSARSEERLKAYAQQMVEFLKRVTAPSPADASASSLPDIHAASLPGARPDPISLTDLAYVLQVGREALEERLALVVPGIQELIVKLTRYCQGRKDEGFYQGNVKANRAKSELLVAGKVGKEFIRTLARERELARLAHLWVLGVDIEWELLYQNSRPRRISVPTYPFARERHWVTVSSVSKRGINPALAYVNQHQLGRADRAPGQGQVPGFHSLIGLHPLIGSNTSTLREQRFSTWLSGDEFFLADHVVGEHKVLPGVAYLEMARAAGEISGERKVRGLRDIVWAQPVTVASAPQQVHISLYPQQQDRVEFEVSTAGESNRRVVHSQGKLVYDGQGLETPTRAQLIDIEAIKTRCRELKSGRECYQAFQSGGLKYGPGFQTIRELFFNGKEALARLEVPQNLKGSIQEFGLHPSLMDGALQTVAGLMASQSEGQEKSSADALYLPFALGEVEIISPLLPETGYAYATVADDQSGKSLPSARSRVKRFNIQLADETGQVLVSMRDFSIRALRQPQKSSPLISGITEANKAQTDKVLVRVKEQELRAGEHELGAGSEQKVKADAQDLRQRIQKDLLKAVSETLKIKEKELDPDEDLSGYGFDSITITEFANRLNEKYNLEITPVAFFDHPSIGSFAQYLSQEYRDRLIPFYQDSLKVTRQPALNEPSEPAEEVFEEIRLKPRFQSFGYEGPQADGAIQYARSEPIAIVGMAGVMPQSEDLEVFWKHLEEGRDLITEIPKDRWDWRVCFGNPAKEANKTNIKWGGFMKEVDKFDAAFFGISPREAELMDPQQRLFLQTVWKTIEDAGYKPSDLSGTKTGLFVGVASSDYQDILRAQGITIEAYTSTGMAHSILANRISFLLNLHGPSEPIDTACSSSLVAIHRAVEAIRAGDCEMAIAGGVNVILSPALYISFSKAGMLCEDGRCKTFDKRANGYVRGEGVGAILLKPLSRAKSEGDHIYALIRGTAENHGGRANSLTAPNPSAQAQLLLRAYERAQLDPATISYIETHGTGTSLGDPIEVEGLKKAFKDLSGRWGTTTLKEPLCGLGTVKTNIGHLEAAAGIAGVIKVLLAMKHKKLPATVHFEELNPYIQLEDSPFYIVKETRAWEPLRSDDSRIIPRRAGVSSFGFGGVNAHIVLEEYGEPCQEHEEPGLQLSPPVQDGQQEDHIDHIIVLSAKNEERLKVYAHQIVELLEKTTLVNSSSAPQEEEPARKAQKEIQEELLRLVCQRLNVTEKDIDLKEDLGEYGLDPVGLTELGNHINEKYNLWIPQAILFEHPSLESLVQYVWEEQRSSLIQHYPCPHEAKRSQSREAVSLADLAYTLQVGREAMEERLALIVSSLKELEEKLVQYCQGSEGEEVYTGNVKANKAKLGPVLTGKIGEEFVKTVIQNREFSKLAQLWVLGMEIDWRLLHLNRTPRRLALPTYPFARKRCWIPASDRGISAMIMNGQGKVLKHHPLLDRNISTLREQKFSTLLMGNEFFLADRMVEGQKVLPELTYLEMALAAGELSAGRKVQRLENIVLARPISIARAPRQVYTSLYPKQGWLEYEVSTPDGDNHGDKRGNRQGDNQGNNQDDNQRVAQRVIHSQGRLIFQRNAGSKVTDNRTDGQDGKDGSSEVINIEAVRQRCQKSSSGEECYRRFQGAGLHYGSGFQAIQELFYNGSEALSRIELPAEMKDGFQEFKLHPVLMDGALQTVIWLMHSQGAELDDTAYSYLPVAVREVEIIKPLSARGYAHVTSAEDQLSDAGQRLAKFPIKRFTIQLGDEKGCVLVRMKDVSIKALRQPLNLKAHPGVVQPDRAGMMYFRSVWERSVEGAESFETAADGQDVLAEGALSGHVLIFDTNRNISGDGTGDATGDSNGQIAQTLQERMTTKGECEAKLIVVKPGQEYREIDEFEYEINPGHRQDYFRLIGTLASRQALPDTVIHLWSLCSRGAMGPIGPMGLTNSGSDYPDSLSLASQPDFKARLALGMYSICYLSQALTEREQKSRRKLRLLYVYSNSNDHPQPQYAAVSGLIKTIRLENPRFIYKAVEIEGAEEGENTHPPSPHQSREAASKILSILLAELRTGREAEVEVRYEGGQRFVRRWQEIDFAREADKAPQDDTDKSTRDHTPTLLREHGVYVITGGLGGLGLIFARYLARQVKAKLVLAGRSDLSARGQDKITGLESLGTEVVYVKADITSKERVQELIAKARQRFGRIHGVIHSAGVVRDALLSKKAPEDMEQVLAPKVYGTLYLDEATRDERLDFFILFSSLAAVTGNIGQADYAYANSFMDNFAAWREGLRARHERSGRSLSIDWPLWQEGGMKVNEQTEIFLARTLGVKTLRTEAGLAAFARGLTLRDNQFLVIEGDRSKVKRVLGIKEEDSHGDSRQGPGARSNPAGNAGKTGQIQSAEEQGLRQKIQEELLKAISGVLKIREQDIDPDDDLSGYGFDSITLTEFVNQLNEKFGITLTPVVFFEHPSISSFARYLCQEHKDRLISYYHGSLGGDEEVEGRTAETDLTGETFEDIELKPKFWSMEIEEGQSGAARLSDEPIAIIGMAGMMPQSEDLDTFWKHLEEGRDLITEIPKDRWDWRAYFGDPAREENKTNIKWGGFMKEVDTFDAAFFGISPREAELMDPQQRLFLQTVWKTIEDAGYKPSDLSGTSTGLFVGVNTSDYHELLKDRAIATGIYTATGVAHSILANRISYLLNLHGPSEPIDAACSSSLVAIHRAVEAIRAGDCDMAIAGGVNVILSPTLYISFSKAGMLSEDGRCKTFDKQANGYVRSEGVGAILLKPLTRAEAEGDHIYALIRGTAENHGGRANSLSAPNPGAQARLLVKAHEKGRIDPATVSYIEVHGTGTSIGDPIEINGIRKAFEELYRKWGKEPPKVPHCRLGTVKTNIGHAEAASGIAGVIKVLLAMKHRKLPATIHLKELNPYIQLQGTPFSVVREPTPWEPLKDHDGQIIPRRAGVNAFGFGGVNAYVILEEYTRPSIKPRLSGQTLQLVLLSAKNKERLQASASQLVEFLQRETARERHEDRQALNLENIAYTLQVGREAMEERLALTVSNTAELVEKLARYCQETPDGDSCGKDGFYMGNVKANKGKAELFIGDKEGEDFVKSLIANRKLNKLAQLWVLGIKIDWRMLYPHHTPDRIPLPTYPFARERYWIPEVENFAAKANPVSGQQGQTSEFHPSGQIELEELKKLFSGMLKMDLDHIDENTTIDQLGVDSILLMEALLTVNKELNLDIKASDVAHLTRVKDFIDLIAQSQEGTNSPVRTAHRTTRTGVSIGQSKYDQHCLEKYQYAFSGIDTLRIFFIQGSQGINTEVITCGHRDAETILLLSPINCLATAWMHQFRELSSRFHLIAVHYPGHGRSEFAPERSDLDSIGQNITEIADLLNITRPFHWVGWSLGGMIALAIGERYPDTVKTLTLVSTTSKIEQDDSLENKYIFSQLLVKDFHSNMPRSMRSRKEVWADCIKADCTPEVSLHYTDQVFKFDFREKISTLAIPTLVIAGGRDKVTPPASGKYICDKIKGSHYCELKTGGHYIPLQNHRYFNQKLMNLVCSQAGTEG
ncbi:MAG: alpha/beta fold hydrolase [bacterium]